MRGNRVHCTNLTVTKIHKNNSTVPLLKQWMTQNYESDKMVTGSWDLGYLAMKVVLLIVYLCM